MHRFTNKAFLFGLFCFGIVLSGCAYISHSTANDLEEPELAKAQRQAVSVWIPMREGFALSMLDTPLLTRQISLYTASGTHLQDTLQMSRPYIYFVLEEVKKRNMPTELALLPFLESSFNVRRGKGLNPAGLWGLMPVAARHLNLANTPIQDERRDIVRSTEAALDLMQELYVKYGDWHLALAAYNWGPGNVSKAIANNQRRKLPTHYLSLNMPIETMVFVPKLLALRKIIENPETYKVTLPDIRNKPFFSRLDVTRTIDISTVTKLAEMSLDEFIDLNPSFNKTFIPASKSQSLLIPVTHLEKFQENYRKFDQALSAWSTVVVERPQSVETFAKQLHVDPNRTRQINGFRFGQILQEGTIVVIPKPSLKG